jgi:hypothetical protein
MSMDHQIIEQEIIKQVTDLMEKSGFESITPVLPSFEKESPEFVDTLLINLKSLNAKYDKNEALYQIKCLMDKYNIQLDELIDDRGIA